MSGLHKNISVITKCCKPRPSGCVACSHATCFSTYAAMLAMLMFGSSCSQADAPAVDADQPTADKIAIDFSGSVVAKGWNDLSSRADPEEKSDNAFHSGDVIGVLAYEIKNYGADNEQSMPSPNIMHNNALILDTGNNWIYLRDEDKAYWPGTNGSFVKFLGVYPHSSHSDGQVTVSGYQSDKASTIKIMPDGKTDIRIAEPTEAYSRKSVMNQNDGKVLLAFRHLLQKVVVKFQTENNSGYSGTVGYVVFNHARYKYEYSFPGNSSQTRNTNDGWSPVSTESGESHIRIKADVKLDNEHHNETSHSVAYLPPVEGILNNMFVVIDGIDYPVKTKGISSAEGGQSLNITVSINTMEKELVCNVTDWVIVDNTEETIY